MTRKQMIALAKARETLYEKDHDDIEAEYWHEVAYQLEESDNDIALILEVSRENVLEGFRQSLEEAQAEAEMLLEEKN